MTQKKTKIVATISNKRCDVSFLQNLYDAGMNVVRINTAHMSPAEAKPLIDNVRKVSDKLAILVDTKGPELRVTEMVPEGDFEVDSGKKIHIYGSSTGELSSIDKLFVNYKNFVVDVPVGAYILIDDGELAFKVLSKTTAYLECEAQNFGIVRGRKSVNVPGVHIKLPSLSGKDIDFVHWAIENDIDFIAHSFVRHKQDVLDIQKILDEQKSHIKIIAKIENQQGVDNIDEILDVAYGVMVARGDLGVEIEAEKIPGIQRMLLKRCRERKKPVIIATQMLHSMIEHPRPTRAEVSDVANAIYQHTDAIMLSGETAYGPYALEAVRTMTKIALEVEPNLKPCFVTDFTYVKRPIAAMLCRSAVEATTVLPIRALLIDSTSGRTGRYLAAFRPDVPIYAKCYNCHVVRELSLSYGIYASYMQELKTKEEFETEAVQSLLSDRLIKEYDLLGIIAGSFGPLSGASFLEITSAHELFGIKP